MTSQSGTGSGALATTSTDSEGQAHESIKTLAQSGKALCSPGLLNYCHFFDQDKKQNRELILPFVLIANFKF